jgi:hypothetical protein
MMAGSGTAFTFSILTVLFVAKVVGLVTSIIAENNHWLG